MPHRSSFPQDSRAPWPLSTDRRGRLVVNSGRRDGRQVTAGLTTGQAIALHGRSVVRQRIRSGAWQQPMRGVVVAHNGPLTADQLERAWLAASPRGSALAGLTAAR